VGIHHDQHVGANGRSERAHPLGNRVQPVALGRIVLRAGAPDLEAAPTPTYECRRTARERFGRTAAAMGVKQDTIAAGAAQQAVHGHSQVLARDVPQRLFDAAQSTVEHDAPAPEPVAVENLPVLLDSTRVAPDQLATLASPTPTIPASVSTLTNTQVWRPP
jgi:hypothetical protein